MITAKFVPVKEKQAEEWSGSPTTVKWQDALKAHAGVNTARRTALLLAVALLAYVVGASIALNAPLFVYVGAVALVAGEIYTGVKFYQSWKKARQADQEYMQGIREVPNLTPSA